MVENSKGGSRGVGFFSLLFLLFLGLKLGGVISWSWWWITAPLWIPFLLIILILVLLILSYLKNRSKMAEMAKNSDKIEEIWAKLEKIREKSEKNAKNRKQRYGRKGRGGESVSELMKKIRDPNQDGHK